MKERMNIKTALVIVAVIAAIGIVTTTIIIEPVQQQQQAFAQGKSPGYGRFNNPGIAHRPPCSAC